MSEDKETHKNGEKELEEIAEKFKEVQEKRRRGLRRQKRELEYFPGWGEWGELFREGGAMMMNKRTYNLVMRGKRGEKTTLYQFGDQRLHSKRGS